MTCGQKLFPVAIKERSEMQKIIDKEGGKLKLEPQDWWYYAEKLRKQKYKSGRKRCSDLILIWKMSGMVFLPLPISFMELHSPQSKTFLFLILKLRHRCKRRQRFSSWRVCIMDFTPEPAKQQGAWETTYRSHHVVDGKEITPV